MQESTQSLARQLEEMQEKTFVIQGSDFQVRVYESVFRMDCSTMIEYTAKFQQRNGRTFLSRLEATATSHKDLCENIMMLHYIISCYFC